MMKTLRMMTNGMINPATLTPPRRVNYTKFSLPQMLHSFCVFFFCFVFLSRCIFLLLFFLNIICAIPHVICKVLSFILCKIISWNNHVKFYARIHDLLT